MAKQMAKADHTIPFLPPLLLVNCCIFGFVVAASVSWAHGPTSSPGDHQSTATPTAPGSVHGGLQWSLPSWLLSRSKIVHPFNESSPAPSLFGKLLIA